MASGGRDDHPLAFPYGRGRRVHRQLSTNDIGNQARYLINSFVHDRLASDGLQAPEVSELIEPNTPQGPEIAHYREVAHTLRVIADELDGDTNLRNLIDRIPPNAPKQSFLNVAREIFRDGVYNWGRITALFYLAYKMALKALNQIPLIRTIVELIVNFIQDHLAQWIIDRGGWEAIQEYLGSTTAQCISVMVAGVLASALIIYAKSHS